MQNYSAPAPHNITEEESLGIFRRSHRARERSKGQRQTPGPKQHRPFTPATPHNLGFTHPRTREMMLENSYSVNKVKDALKILNEHFVDHGEWYYVQINFY